MNLTLEELRAAAALKEQKHRQALAFLEVARQQQKGPLPESRFASSSVTPQGFARPQTEGPGAAGARTIANQPVNAALLNSGGAAPRKRSLGDTTADLNNLLPSDDVSVHRIGDGRIRILAVGGANRMCFGDADEGGCSLQYDRFVIGQTNPGAVYIQELDENNEWQLLDFADAPPGGGASCSVSKNRPKGSCMEIEGPPARINEA